MQLKNYLTAVLFSVSSAIYVNAIPAYPGIIKSQQPDGTEIEIRLYGDEHMNWASTPDGYTLVRDADDFWAFATMDNAGNLVPSSLKYANNSSIAKSQGIIPGLSYSAQQLKSQQSKSKFLKADETLQVEGTYPSKGKTKLLMLLLNYSDTEPIYTQSDFNDYMNKEGYAGIGSFRDYYLENSYGQLDIETTVTRWVTLPQSKAYYGSEMAVEMIQAALITLDDEINLKDFDNDGDGILDGLAVIHQGGGQEYTGGINDIWSHSSIIYGMEFDGVQVRRYTIEPELLGNSTQMSTIGVMCHEFGHNLGAPDFYDTDYSSTGGDYSGTGVWDLMGNGAWNGESGNRPAGTNMWQKIQYGWVTPALLTESATISGMKSADSNPVAYRFDTTVPGEYFILENRQQVGTFDVALPGHGLIVYHANESLISSNVANNEINIGYPQAMYTVCASATTDPDGTVSSYGNINSSGAPFPGSSSATEFSDRTIPSTKSITGRYSYKGLSNIAESTTGEISFDFSQGESPNAPINLKSVVDRGVVTLSWEMPAGTADLLNFNIYRNDEHIATTESMSYVDRGVSSETVLNYNVDAAYASGLISPYASASIRIPSNKVVEVLADTTATTVDLSWNLNTKLTRMQSETDYAISQYNVSSLDYAQRFRADDLKAYKGYKIRRIAYLPYQIPQEIKLTLRVWKNSSDGLNPTILSERVVSEFGSSIWNQTLLTKSVEITGEDELWIGMHVESTTGNIQLITDRGPIINNYGNLIKLQGEEWKVNTEALGNYYLFVPLVEPAASAQADVPEYAGPINAELDLFYPIGFTVYRDDIEIGKSATRSFTDNSPLVGTHTYSIASLYKGDNESAALPIEVTFGQLGVESVLSETVSVVTDGSNVAINGYSGDILIADLMGRVVYSGEYVSGEYITLCKGIYLLKAGDAVYKIAIR